MERFHGAMFAEVEVVAGGAFFWLALLGDGSAASEFEDLLLSVMVDTVRRLKDKVQKQPHCSLEV